MDVERVKRQAWATMVAEDIRRDRAELDRLALARDDASRDQELETSYALDADLLATKIGVEMADLEDQTGSPDECQRLPADDLTLGECCLWGQLVTQTGSSISPRAVEAEVLSRVRAWFSSVATACTCIEDSNLGRDSQPTDADVATAVSNMSALTAALSDMGEALGSSAMMCQSGAGETAASMRRALVSASTTALARSSEAVSAAKAADVVRDERVAREVDRLEDAERDLARKADVERADDERRDEQEREDAERDERERDEERAASRERQLATESSDAGRTYEGIEQP